MATTGASHPLDPLSAAEITTARDTILEHLSSSGPPPRFTYITLLEPSPRALAKHARSTSAPPPWPPRVAEALLHNPPVAPRLLRVRLDAPRPAVVHDHALDAHAQPMLTPADCLLAEAIVQADANVRQLVSATYGAATADALVCDPWSVHLPAGRLPPGVDDPPEHDPQPRLVQTFLYAGDADRRDSHNHYARPLHLVPLVDLRTRAVVAVHGARGVPAAVPRAVANYWPEAMSANTYLPTEPDAPTAAPRPLQVSQPRGPSFTLAGRELAWGQWRLRIGFNFREGVTLHDVSFAGRAVLRRASLVEMAVPYADPRAPFDAKCAFDVGDYGLGYCAVPLSRGCDCLGEIVYLDAVLADEHGRPYSVEKAVCVHEEEAGVLHKHVEYRTGRSFVRRARKLVVSFVATVVNYEYLFYWWLHTDGSLGLDVRLSGELSTNVLSAGETGDALPTHGTRVAPDVNAQLHQHMFCARLLPAVDGARNRVSEVDVVAADGDVGVGNAFRVVETLLTSEKQAMRHGAPARSWRVANAAHVNRVAGKPVAYRLVPGTHSSCGAQPLLQTAASSAVSARARFATRALWVTPGDAVDDGDSDGDGDDDDDDDDDDGNYGDGVEAVERFPAGDFPTQARSGPGVGEQGLPAWTARDRSVVDRALVLWHSFGVVHMPRTEDFPIMPCEVVGFAFKPDCFFDGNPALTLRAPAGEEHATGNGDANSNGCGNVVGDGNGDGGDRGAASSGGTS